MQKDHLTPSLSPPAMKITAHKFHEKTLRHFAARQLWKKLLPFFAVFSFALVFIWPILEDHFTLQKISPYLNQTITHTTVTNKLIKPRIHSIDKQGRPVILSAASALQTSDHTAKMNNPSSQVQLENGQKVFAQANQGFFNSKKQYIDYRGDVQFQMDKGITLNTASASLNLNDHMVYGHQPVSGYSQSGSLSGQGFKITNHGKRLHLFGKSKLIIPSTLSKNP